MKDRQRAGLAILLFIIGELQVVTMLDAMPDPPGAVFLAVLSLLCLGVGVVMLVVREA